MSDDSDMSFDVRNAQCGHGNVKLHSGGIPTCRRRETHVGMHSRVVDHG